MGADSGCARQSSKVRWAGLARSASGCDEVDGVARRLIRCASLGMAVRSPWIAFASYGSVVWERDDREVELTAGLSLLSWPGQVPVATRMTTERGGTQMVSHAQMLCMMDRYSKIRCQVCLTLRKGRLS